MKIGVDIPTEKNIFTFSVILLIIGSCFLRAGPNFENLNTSWIILLCIPYFLYYSFVRSRKYTVDDSGITAHYWGIFHLHRTWDYFGDVGVFLIHHGTYSDLSYIICSKKQWQMKNKIRRSEQFERYPFSVFCMIYTPERFEEFKKHCPRITYFADSQRVASCYAAFKRRHLQKKQKNNQR